MVGKNFPFEEIAPNTLRINEFGLGTIYLVCGKCKALVIDTGTGFGNLKGFVEFHTDLPYKVVATHGHFDHIGGRLPFDELYINEKDLPWIPIANVHYRKGYAQIIQDTYQRENPLFSMDDITEGEEPEIKLIKQGDTFDLGDRKLVVYETPGHTAGSISLLDEKEKILFSGDAFQPITLLTMDAPDREFVLRLWLKHALNIYSKKDCFHMICGGHEKVDIQVLPDLIKCVQGLLDCSIVMSKTKIHILCDDRPEYH